MQTQTSDLVVIGSGAAGLMAALTAATADLEVTVLESANRLGGTTSLSGGMVFAPGNSLAEAEGHTDSRTDVLRYLTGVARLPLDEKSLDTFLDTIPEAVDFLKSQGLPLRTSPLQDYFQDAPGASSHRSIAFQPCEPPSLGDDADLVRVTPHRAVPDGEPWTNGMALVGHLVRACRAAGVDFRTEWRATGLDVQDGTVVGVHGGQAGTDVSVSSRTGVVLAAGGFEFNADLLEQYAPGEVEGAWSCPDNRGDVLQMALEAGADVEGFDVQWYPLLRLSNETYEGPPLMNDASPARNLPGSIIVNKHGSRFVNESALYQDVGRELSYADGPTWLIADHAFASAYGSQAFGTAALAPPHVFTADTIAELAALIGVDEVALEQTILSFNKDAETGQDTAFGRGASNFDQSWGDGAKSGAAACLAPLATGPFHATRVFAGCSGTTGGPVIDTDSRVLRPDGSPIAGLYAAGNTVANPFGGVAPSSGGTLGPGFSTGYRAARAAAIPEPAVVPAADHAE